MTVRILGKFSIYGPDMLLMGLVSALAMAVASATGVVTSWMSSSVIGALLVVRASSLWHEQLEKYLYSVARKLVRWLLSLIKRSGRLRAAATIIVRLLMLVAAGALVAIMVIGVWSLSGTVAYVIFGTSLAIAVVGITGQVIWYRWRTSEWKRLNPQTGRA